MPPPPPSPPLVRAVRTLAHDFTSRLPTDSPASTTPTRTISLASRISRLIPRLATNVSTVPQGYGNAPSGPDPGVVVGIVLGSIAGFLLVLWLVYTCVNLGNGRSTNIIVEREGSMVSDSVVTRKSRKHRRSHRNHSRSRSVGRRETIEIREQRVHVPERIVVEETTRSRGPPPPRMPVPGPPPPRQQPPPMSDSEDDEVVVIEEHTPPRRRESRRHRRRSSERRSTERRSSGYRDVDPYRYAGGDEPMRSMSRRRSESRSRYG